MTVSKTPLSALLLAAALGATANGALLVREGFDNYAAATSFTAGTTATNATGLTGNYKNNNAGTYTATAGGLAFSDYNTAGGNKLSAPFTGGGTSLQAQLSLSTTVPAGSTLWSSYLVRYSTISAGPSSLSEVRIHPSDAGTGGGARFRSMSNSADGVGNTFAGISYGATIVTASSPSSQLAATTTYMVISSFSNVGGSGAATATQWVLTEAQYNDFRDAGSLSFANLTARTAGAGATNAFSIISDTATSLTFGSGLYLQIAGNSDQATYDEIRYATTLSEVVTAIPEPGSMALAGLGAIAFLRRRR